MQDIIKAAFSLAADGYAAPVLIILLLVTLFMLNHARKHQAKAISHLEDLAGESTKVDNLGEDLKSLTEDLDRCFTSLNSFIDDKGDKSSSELGRQHSEVTSAQHRILDAANLISKDIAELKGMFNAAIAGIHKGIK